MISLFIFFLLFIVPGFIALLVYEHVSRNRIRACCSAVSVALIFDLLILIVNFLGLFFLKHIYTVEKLVSDFNCLKFTSKYGLLSIAVGAVLAMNFGIICRWWDNRKHSKPKKHS